MGWIEDKDCSTSYNIKPYNISVSNLVYHGICLVFRLLFNFNQYSEFDANYFDTQILLSYMVL